MIIQIICLMVLVIKMLHLMVLVASDGVGTLMLLVDIFTIDGCVLASVAEVSEFKPNSGNFHLPPTSPTSPPSCNWVPSICWGANSRPFLMKQQWSRWDFGCPHNLLRGKA